MSVQVPPAPIFDLLPAQRFDASGRARVDWRVVLSLAGPLIANSAIQALLNLTDTWFIGRLSTDALAAIAAIHWLVIVFIALLGGVGLAVQTLVAQAFGGRRWSRASQAAWSALWASLFTMPVFAAVAFCGESLLAPFGLAPEIQTLALEFWRPRLLGAPLAVALWAVLGFFNGIGRPRITFMVDGGILLLNALLAQLFIFELDLGIAGAAWATNCATSVGLAFAICVFLMPAFAGRYRSRLTWRLRWRRLASQLRVGFPMGVIFAADMVGFALFQLMQVRLSAVDGAATQIAMMLTSLAYLPAVGIAMAGTTLVGQSIGAGSREWAGRVGNRIILLSTVYMGVVGLLLGFLGPWLVPLFVAQGDVQGAEVIRAGALILWIAAAYQLFDGLNLGSSFCLRGAGDSVVPAAMVILLSWFLFVPAAHMLSFKPGQGWTDWLPQFGLGAVGGWLAAVLYICALGIAMFLRWRSGAWQRIRLR